MAKSTYKPGFKVGITAAADIAAGLFVTTGGAVCGADAKAIGISEYAMNTGEHYGVIASGTALLKIAGTVSKGDYIKSDANGKGLAATLTAGALTESLNAIALQDGVNGDTIEVFLIH